MDFFHSLENYIFKYITSEKKIQDISNWNLPNKKEL